MKLGKLKFNVLYFRSQIWDDVVDLLSSEESPESSSSLTIKDDEYTLFHIFFSILKLNIVRTSSNNQIIGSVITSNKYHQEFDTIWQNKNAR